MGDKGVNIAKIRRRKASLEKKGRREKTTFPPSLPSPGAEEQKGRKTKQGMRTRRTTISRGALRAPTAAAAAPAARPIPENDDDEDDEEDEGAPSSTAPAAPGLTSQTSAR